MLNSENANANEKKTRMWMTKVVLVGKQRKKEPAKWHNVTYQTYLIRYKEN